MIDPDDLVLIWRPTLGEYWRGPGSGVTTDPREAGRYRRSDAERFARIGGLPFELHLARDHAPPPPPAPSDPSGAVALAAALAAALAEIARLQARVEGLLHANSALIEQRRAAAAKEPDAPALQDILAAIGAEVTSAEAKWPPMNSAHEAYAVLLEEVDELKAHVWTNQKRRDLAAMRAEAIQVAAMAVRFVRDVCDADRGRK